MNLIFQIHNYVIFKNAPSLWYNLMRPPSSPGVFFTRLVNFKGVQIISWALFLPLFLYECILIKNIFYKFLTQYIDVIHYKVFLQIADAHTSVMKPYSYQVLINNLLCAYNHVVNVLGLDFTLIINKCKIIFGILLYLPKRNFNFF